MNSKEDYKAIIDRLINKERSKRSDEYYQKFHAERYQRSLKICMNHVADRNAHVLDIGRSTFTKKLSSYYHSVYSMGFDLELDQGAHREDTLMPNIPHIEFDLNRAGEVDSWPNYPNMFDLIVYAETIEHIYTAPEYSLLMFSYLLKPDGCIIVTTPNAASIRNRVYMILGYNPFERIRYYSQNPGHYREYTLNEIKEIGKNVGLYIKTCYATNLYSEVGWRKIVTPLKILPQFKDSVVAVYQKTESITPRKRESTK